MFRIFALWSGNGEACSFSGSGFRAINAFMHNKDACEMRTRNKKPWKRRSLQHVMVCIADKNR